MRKLIGGAALLAVIATFVVVATALATPGSLLTSSTFSLGRFQAIDLGSSDPRANTRSRGFGASDVYVVSNTFAPGGHSGWHTHPGPSLITVKAGTITAYEADDPTCTPHVYTAGTGFVDPGGSHTHLLRNEGSVDAMTVAVQILPAGTDRRIDAPATGNCSF